MIFASLLLILARAAICFFRVSAQLSSSRNAQ